MKDEILKNVIHTYVVAYFICRFGLVDVGDLNPTYEDALIKHDELYKMIDDFVNSHYYDYIKENYNKRDIDELFGLDDDDTDEYWNKYRKINEDEYYKIQDENDKYAINKTVDFIFNLIK